MDRRLKSNREKGTFIASLSLFLAEKGNILRSKSGKMIFFCNFLPKNFVDKYKICNFASENETRTIMRTISTTTKTTETGSYSIFFTKKVLRSTK